MGKQGGRMAADGRRDWRGVKGEVEAEAETEYSSLRGDSEGGFGERLRRGF